MPVIFLEFGLAINLGFQVILPAGGIITIIGAIVAARDPLLGRTIVFLGGLVGGVNVLTLYGAVRIFQHYSDHTSQWIPRPITTAEEAIMAMGEAMENPLPPESTIWWINEQNSRARAEWRPVPSWEEFYKL